MKENMKKRGLSRTALNYLTKILTIYRTRNVYGYNSMFVRILRLFIVDRRHNGPGVPGVELQY
jgi:hypothetical protein